MTTFNTSHILALSIFFLYFLLIFILLYTIIASIFAHSTPQIKSGRILVFGGLLLGSYGHTWYWMSHFMAWSFHDFENMHPYQSTLAYPHLLRVARWLNDTALFEQAWSAVCTEPLNWWWSEQLCLFTAGAFTIFLFMQRHRVPHVWAYMLLGQVVAISVAWSLLSIALVVIPSRNATSAKNTLLPPSLTVPVLLSFLTISLSPYTSPSTFLPNLLAMHALLILPLLPIPTYNKPLLSPRATSFYTLVALLSLLLRTRTTLSVLTHLNITSSPFFSLRYLADVVLGLWKAPGIIYERAWETLHSHPAQASIGWDIIWTGAVWLAWGVCGERVKERKRWTFIDVILQALQVLVASVGVVAPLGFGHAVREEEEAAEVGGEVKNK